MKDRIKIDLISIKKLICYCNFRLVVNTEKGLEDNFKLRRITDVI